MTQNNTDFFLFRVLCNESISCLSASGISGRADKQGGGER